MSPGPDGELAKIREAFAAYFNDFDIHLPADIEPSGGLIKQAGWNIPTPSAAKAAGAKGVTFNRDIPGDRERAERERKATHERLIAELKRVGPW